MSDDDRKIKTRVAADMTVEDLQVMRNILSWTVGPEILGLRLGGLLDFYHRANDAGYVSWVEWYGDEPAAAERARVRLAKKQEARDRLETEQKVTR